jgi:hypothetical protein
MLFYIIQIMRNPCMSKRKGSDMIRSRFLLSKGNTMRYPNMRYGNPTEFRAYVKGIPLKDLAKQLKRSERTVSDWINEVKRIPYWVPELLRLRHVETDLYLRELGYKRLEEKERRGKTAANDRKYTLSDCHPANADKPKKLLRHG